MNLALRTWLICCSFLTIFGCSSSGPVASKPQSHEEACTVLLDYTNQYERTYLQYEGEDMLDRLSKVGYEYHNRMSKLAEQGKWTPLQEFGTDMKLSFLVGQFQGAVQSCKVEQGSHDKSTVACDQANELKNKMIELLSR